MNAFKTIIYIMQNLWLQTRRHFYEILKKQVDLILGPSTSELKKYAQNYHDLFKQVWEVSSHEEIRHRIEQAHIILGGDFHPFSQSQRTHLRLLRELQKTTSKKIILALEMFDVKDQKLLQKYLTGKIEITDFWDECDWTERWPGIPTNGYERLLEWAKKQQVEVHGVNSLALNSLKERDEFSGKKINELSNKNPEALVYVLYGEFHLADRHLTRQIKSYDSGRDLRILLNSEELYFELAEHAVEDRFDVLRLEDRFCILSSPPWVKWQSYLLSLQELDDEFIDDYEEWDIDLTEYIAQILSLLVADFGLPDMNSTLSIYSSSEMDLEYLYKLDLDDSDAEKLKYIIATEKNLILPEQGIQYLGRTTVNQAASLAGEILHARLCQRRQVIWDPGLCFEAKIWIEAVSFFLSLTINPKRQAVSEKDLKAQLEAQGEKEYAIDVLQFALDFRLSVVKKAQGETRQPLIRPKDWQIEMEASVILGEMMGQRLYEAFRLGLIRREQLVHYFSLPLDSLKFMAMFDFLNAKLENKENLN